MPAVRKVHDVRLWLRRLPASYGMGEVDKLSIEVQTDQGRCYYDEHIPDTDLVAYFDLVMDRAKDELRALLETGRTSKPGVELR